MWKRLFGRRQKKQPDIIIVSGLPRSGTSMMMRMLEAGGIEIVTDHIRKADEDNPQGYYELEKVKEIKQDFTFLNETYGKVFKMISILLYELPLDKSYKIIFMKRNMTEILNSQKIMLQRNAKDRSENNDDVSMGNMFEKHINDMTAWLAQQPNTEVIYINYNDVITAPLASAQVVEQFLNRRLNVDKMAAVVDPTLYRNRVSSP
ncbi:hypothetical protein NKDENANG_02971 [Candidatus Entotheonellaceae bacterium PAL068K]